ncbi:MAG: type pilus assembly protein PilM [Patescibacteria group bacterium]|nr:type pilus assembly protein PilM [Patescibacteria group bacterium]
MFTKTFFKLFPPPKYLNIPYAGVDISDDAIRCIEYSQGHHGYTLHRYGTRILKPGIVDSGYIKDEKALVQELTSLAQELKITTVKASLPEERMYLFKTEVPDTNEDQIRQNIEFKLEENVPLSPADAIFFFDLLPDAMNNESKTMVSVSVTPRELVHSYLNAFQAAGLTVVSFEIQAKAIARAVVPRDSKETQLIVNVMNKKTGLYVVSGGVLCFTSTVPWGGELIRNKNVTDTSDDIFSLRHEIERVYTYWSEHGEGQPIKSIIISGHDAAAISQISHISPNPNIQLQVAHVWQNAFSGDHYVPAVTFEDSLDYAIAAGLALP